MMKALLITPDAESEGWIRAALVRHGYEVTIADPGAGALEATDDLRLVILGPAAWDEAAQAACRQWREQDRTGRRTILAIAPADRPELPAAVLAAGADDYVRGPQDLPRLEARLALAARGDHTAAQVDAPASALAARSPVAMAAELQTIYEHSPDGILVAEWRSKRFLRANSTICQMLGYGEAELLELAVPDIHPPDEIPRAVAAFEAMVEGRFDRAASLRCRRKDGSVFYADVITRRLPFQGRPCLIGFFHDVTEQRQTMELLRIQRDLGAALSTTTDLGEALQQILEAIGRMEGIDCGGVFTVDADDGRMRHVAHRGVSEEFAAFVAEHPGDSPESQAIRAGRPLYQRAPPVTPATYDACQREGIRALAVVPVWHGGKVIASLHAASRRLEEFPPATRHALEAIASRLGGVIARLEAQAALQESEEKFKAFVGQSAYGYAELDLGGNILFANRQVAAMLGYEPEEGPGKHFSQFVDPEDLPRAVENLQRLLTEPESGAGEYKARAKDGTLRYVEVNSLPLTKGGRVVGFQSTLLDVTERHHAVERLRESEQRYRMIADNVADVIWSVPFDTPEKTPDLSSGPLSAAAIGGLLQRWRLNYASPSVERLLGYSVAEVLALTLPELLTPDSLTRAIEVIRESLRRKSESGDVTLPEETIEVRLIARDRSIRWCEVATTFLHDGQGRLTGLLGVLRDISARREAEQALREHDAKLRGLFENLPDLVTLVSREEVIEFANRGLAAVPAADLVGRSALGYVAPEYQALAHQTHVRAVETGEIQAREVQDVFGLWWATRLVPMVEEGQVRHVMAICTDITRQKQAAEAIEKEQQLLRQLLDLHERDRQVIAYEVHDGVAQQLTSALYHLEAYRQLRAKDPEQARKTFESGMGLLGESIAEARRLISGLRPPILDEFGIIAAVEYLVSECRQRCDATVEFLHDVEFERLAPPLESAIFRIVQEGLSNACRHSRSQRIRVELFQGAGHIQVHVRDWGVGFELGSVPQGRFGLQGIRERTRLLGGQAAIITAPNQGTQISVELPLVERAPEP